MNTNLKIRMFSKQNIVFVLFASIMMLGCNSKAQEKTKTANTPSFAVSTENNNILYAGMPNPVTVTASVAPEKVRIFWGGAMATVLGGGRYEVSVPTSFVGKTIDVTLFAETEEDKNQKLGTVSFHVKSVSEPNVRIGLNITGGSQSKEVLLKNPFIAAIVSPDFNYGLRWEVLSYKVTFIINGDEKAPIMVNGARFSELVLNKIQNAPSGTIIEFSEIKIQSTAGIRNILNPIVVRIQ